MRELGETVARSPARNACAGPATPGIARWTTGSCPPPVDSADKRRAANVGACRGSASLRAPTISGQGADPSRSVVAEQGGCAVRSRVVQYRCTALRVSRIVKTRLAPAGVGPLPLSSFSRQRLGPGAAALPESFQSREPSERRTVRRSLTVAALKYTTGTKMSPRTRQRGRSRRPSPPLQPGVGQRAGALSRSPATT